MLFRQDVLRRIGEGDVTLAFRRWRRPTVRAGGTLRTRVGVLAIDSVERVDEEHVTDADARRAGAADRETLLAGLPGDGALHRRRAQAEGAWAHREPGGGLPALAAWPHLLRIQGGGAEAVAEQVEDGLALAVVGDQALVVAGGGVVLRRAAAGPTLPSGGDLKLAQRPVDRS